MLAEFYQKFFCTGSYNLVNTVVSTLVILFLAVFVIYPLVRKSGVEIDRKFLMALIPYIFFGAFIRILEDIDFLQGSCNPLTFDYYTVMPGFALGFGFIMLLIVIFCSFLSKRIGKEFNICFFWFGIALCLPAIIFLLINLVNPVLVIASIIISAAILFAVKFLLNFSKINFIFDKINYAILFGESLDGVTSTISIKLLNCSEKHVLSHFLLSTHFILFIVAKLALMLFIIWLIDNKIENKKAALFMKTVLLILTLFPGFRNLFLIAVGFCGTLI